ncbi:hypothetical protein BJ878DRAFT_195239 [Calycina marina]|uniref:Uncharacterized protein n=1 Tax=Calycina marina TaxID=1763456 RepID=A0A9P7YXW0_9HELO|nr:hypothetical protein BJ878DRAFT_195239 [Calycina marina]
MTTPRFDFDMAGLGTTPNGKPVKKRPQQVKIVTVEGESDIDADDLLPVYLESKAKLFEMQASLLGASNTPRSGKKISKKAGILVSMSDPTSAKLVRKIQKIEDDVLFDRYIAEMEWETRRIQHEKDAAVAAVARKLEAETASIASQEESETVVDSDDGIGKEAAKIGGAMLEENQSDDDATLADLFASLPVNEVDPLTGKSSTVITGNDGVRVTIRDFGKWTGVNPTRVLEEACRAR